MSGGPDMKGYPIFLVGLENRRCVVIGGGREAERKVTGLLESDARVTVIAADVTSKIRQWAIDGRIEWTARDFQPGDCRDAFLVIAENVGPEVSSRIWAETQDGLVNVMDDVDHCTFIAGSVMKQGPLTIAISTNGCAPTLAVRLREKFQQEFGPEYGTFLELMRDLREPIARCYPDLRQRKVIWYALVDSDVLDLLRARDIDGALARIAEIAGPEVLETVVAGR